MKTFFLFTFAISLTILTVEAKPRGKIIGGEEAPKRKKLIECKVIREKSRGGRFLWNKN